MDKMEWQHLTEGSVTGPSVGSHNVYEQTQRLVLGSGVLYRTITVIENRVSVALAWAQK